MSRLAKALEEVTTGLTGDEVHEIIGGSRATAHRWLRDLRENHELGTWSAAGVEALAGYEATHRGTSMIINALRLEEIKYHPVKVQEVRRQICETQRKTSSLMNDLLEVGDSGDVSVEAARVLLLKSIAAQKEAAGQQSILSRLRQQLLQRIKGNGEL